MGSVTRRTVAGGESGTVELDDALFGIEPNGAVMHQVVTAQLAARRAGTQSTKTRAEVRGGGAKPWKQKGTGRARQGSIRSPQWRGGGVALGPKPRSYKQRTPKKMVRLALRSALSDRAAEGRIVVVDEWGFDAPSTKGAVAALAALGVEGRALIVVDRADEATWKSFRNLPLVHVTSPGELNAYDVLVADWLVFSEATLPTAAVASVPEASPAPVESAPAPEVAPTDAAPAPEDAPHGAGSAAPLADGSAPEGFTIKGNADSMLYHPPDTPFYERTVAEVWFDSPESAEAAGFSLPASLRTDDADDDAGSDEEEA